MQYEFNEGDWVRHHSCAVPIRVIGIGATIAVEYPNGDMRALEPCELEKTLVANTSVHKVNDREHRRGRWFGTAERFVLLIVSIYLVALALVVISGAMTP